MGYSGNEEEERGITKNNRKIMKRVLIACEESQAVTIEMRKIGVEAFSCDIEPCSGGHPEWHIQGDVIPLLTYWDWEMIIAFPPCTHLSISGARWFKEKRKDGRQQQGIDFFMQFANVKCERIAIENPIGIMSTIWRKPNQIIQPYWFGDSAQKATCLWLKNLPLLKPTNIVNRGEIYITKSGKKRGGAWTMKLPPSKDRAKIRSKTFLGIAKAMAEQWGKLF